MFGEWPLPPDAGSCVYFLVAGGRLVYIGETNRLCRRLLDHVTRVPGLTTAFWLATPGIDSLPKAEAKQARLSVERVLVHRFLPAANYYAPAPTARDVALFDAHVGHGALTSLRARFDALGVSTEGVSQEARREKYRARAAKAHATRGTPRPKVAVSFSLTRRDLALFDRLARALAGPYGPPLSRPAVAEAALRHVAAKLGLPAPPA